MAAITPSKKRVLDTATSNDEDFSDKKVKLEDLTGFYALFTQWDYIDVEPEEENPRIALMNCHLRHDIDVFTGFVKGVIVRCTLFIKKNEICLTLQDEDGGDTLATHYDFTVSKQPMVHTIEKYDFVKHANYVSGLKEIFQEYTYSTIRFNGGDDVTIEFKDCLFNPAFTGENILFAPVKLVKINPVNGELTALRELEDNNNKKNQTVLKKVNFTMDILKFKMSCDCKDFRGDDDSDDDDYGNDSTYEVNDGGDQEEPKTPVFDPKLMETVPEEEGEDSDDLSDEDEAGETKTMWLPDWVKLTRIEPHSINPKTLPPPVPAAIAYLWTNSPTFMG